MKDKNLEKGFLDRFDENFHPSVETRPDKPCQYCQYKAREIMKETGIVDRPKCPMKNVTRCIPCNVELCTMCFAEFHGCAIGAQLKTFA